MAARPCPTSLTGCAGSDSPITNISAEAPDPLLFARMVWTQWNPYRPPPLGNGIDVRVECTPAIQEYITGLAPIVMLTPESQAYADLIALAQSLQCEFPTGDGDQQYINDEQCASVTCPDGTIYTFCVPAGTLTSELLSATVGAAWVEYANAWAYAYAQQQASLLMDCIERFETDDPEADPAFPDAPPAPPPSSPPGPTPPTHPSGGGYLPDPVWLCFGTEFWRRYSLPGARTTAYTIEISAGTLPPGCTMVQTSNRGCVISGWPTAAGCYTFTIRGTSTTLPATTVQVSDTVCVFGITNADTLPDAEVGQPYSHDLTATGGTVDYTFTLDAGSTLPDNFTLDADGTLHSDNPTTDGDYTFDVTVTDANGGECSQTVQLTVTPACPEAIADLVWTITTYSYQSPNTVWSAAAAGGSGTWSIQLNSPPPPPPPPPVIGPEQQFWIYFNSTFCNRTAFNIPISLNFPVDAVGAVFNGSLFHNVAVRLWVNGVLQDSDGSDLIAFFPPPQTYVLTGILPASTDCNILIEVVNFALPNVSVTAFSNPSWTLT